MAKYILRLISICIIAFGIFLIIKPSIIIQKLKLFYSRYPIIRYAGEKQLISRPQFVVILGIIIILIGILSLIWA